MNRLVDVLLVTSPGCHYCDDALDLLDELAQAIPMKIRTVPIFSDEGRSIIVRHKVPFPPVLIIDGRFFGYGRVSRRKLEAHLAGASTSRRVG